MNEQEMELNNENEPISEANETENTGNEETVNDGQDKLKEELAASKDQYLRLVAEFDNFRKRNAKERNELVQTASKDLMQAMLSILDDSERAEKNLETATDVAALKEGIQLILNKLKNTLMSKGLTAMDAGSGSDFDPELHEAITEIPAPSDALKGKVVDVVEKGYYMNDKLIRHAKVVVGK